MANSLWSQLSTREMWQWQSQFMHLSPSAILSMNINEFSMLLQWMLAFYGKETVDVTICGSAIDLELEAKRGEFRQEFARAYCGSLGMPVNALYDLQVKLKGRTYYKISVYTLKNFSKAQKRIVRDFPLIVELHEGNDFFRQYFYAKRQFQETLNQRKGIAQPKYIDQGNFLDRFFRRK